jgi:Protein of unknown function (DUF429)
MQLLGCDFSSSPAKRKPIVVALGTLQSGRVRLQSLQTFDTLESWGQWLAQPGPWVGGFDLPFGLPRELVETLGWPTDWAACMDHYAALDRLQIRAQFAAFCDARPAGGKFAHRATDRPAASSPSMKWVNPPVAYMLHAGVPWLRRVGAHLPGLLEGDRSRVALEAYPGLLAREVLGNTSYKSDDKAKQTPARWLARRELLGGLERGQTRLGLRLSASHALMARLADDASGDALDATLCLMQAAWAWQQHEAGHPRYGLPVCDPLEGWIVTA